MARKFPTTREDGTFCVLAKFVTSQDASILEDQVNEWCDQWVKAQRPTEPDRDYYESFSSPPYVIRADGSQLWLRLDSAPRPSDWWKDLMVSVTLALVRAFPNLQHEKFENCDE